jgi:hypothetical protein
MNGEYANIWEEDIVAIFKVLFLYMPRQTEENYEELSTACS